MIIHFLPDKKSDTVSKQIYYQQTPANDTYKNLFRSVDFHLAFG